MIGGTLLNMAVFGAMISYAMQGLSFILLRKNMPNIVRPYRSPVGVPGAVVTVVIALVTLYYQLQDPVYRDGVYAVAAFYVLGILYFALYGTEPAHPLARGRVRARARARKVTPEGAALRAVSGEPGARRASGAPLLFRRSAAGCVDRGRADQDRRVVGALGPSRPTMGSFNERLLDPARS